MRTTLSFVAAILAVALIATNAHAEDAPEADDFAEGPYVKAGILVVSSHHTYATALRAAKDFSRESGLRYDSRGMIFALRGKPHPCTARPD